MAFKAMTSKKTFKRLPTAEEFYDANEEAFSDGDVVMYVHEIVITQYGYKLNAEFCSVFCSFKYWSVAKVIKAYIKDLKDKQEVQSPMIAVNVPNEKGFCDWNFGIDTGKDSKQSLCIFDPGADDSDDDGYLFPQPGCIEGFPEDWTYNSYQPDPNTPASKVAKAETAARKRASKAQS